MLAIRLSRKGSKHRPFYRVVAIDKSRPTTSKYVDLLGYYNPMLEEPEIRIDLEKYNKWIEKGAKPSQTVKSLVKKVKTDN
jgi:small subunit ribosomal protein S16